MISKVAVIFLSGTSHKRYYYFTDLNVKVDDHVVVEASGVLNVVCIVDVQPVSNNVDFNDHKWVVDTINEERYTMITNLIAQIKDLDQQLEKRRREIKREVIENYIDNDATCRRIKRDLRYLIEKLTD